MPTFAEAAQRLRDQLSFGLALPAPRSATAQQLGATCHSPIRRDANLGGDGRRRDRDSGSDLARGGDHRPKAPPARPGSCNGPWKWNSGGDNPCDRIGPALGAHNYVVKHMKALPHAEVAAAIGKVRASNTKSVLNLALEFLVLTATRGSEVRGLRGRRSTWTTGDEGSTPMFLPDTIGHPSGSS